MTSASAVIKVGKAEVGYHEGRSASGHWNNDQKYSKDVPGLEWSNYQAWCCTFVAWCAKEAGAGSLYPVTAGCSIAVSWFKQRKAFSDYPAVGAQIFFGPGGGSHTGIVYDYDADYVYTIEGNTNTNGSAEGDGVYLKKRTRKDSYVYGYGYPAFSEGIKSADPAWKDKAPKPPTKTPTKPKPAPAPAPAKKVVDLSNVIDAARRDPGLKQGGTTHPADVKLVETALKAEGLLPAKYAADGSYGTLTKDAYKTWQTRLGYRGTDADGIPGMASLSKLGSRHGFGVKA